MAFSSPSLHGLQELFTDYKVPEGSEKEGDVKQWQDMVSNSEKGERQGNAVLDARPEGRYVPLYSSCL